MIFVRWEPNGNAKSPPCTSSSPSSPTWSDNLMITIRVVLWYASYRGGGRPNIGRHRGSRMRRTAGHPHPSDGPAFLQQSSLNGQIQFRLFSTLLPLWTVSTLLQLLFSLHRPTTGKLNIRLPLFPVEKYVISQSYLIVRCPLAYQMMANWSCSCLSRVDGVAHLNLIDFLGGDDDAYPYSKANRVKVARSKFVSPFPPCK